MIDTGQDVRDARQVVWNVAMAGYWREMPLEMEWNKPIRNLLAKTAAEAELTNWSSPKPLIKILPFMVRCIASRVISG